MYAIVVTTYAVSCLSSYLSFLCISCKKKVYI